MRQDKTERERDTLYRESKREIESERQIKSERLRWRRVRQETNFGF